MSLPSLSFPTEATENGGIVVFSGGTAANSLVDVFRTVTEKRACPLSYVIPISDNGGSSSELIRVFGGPGIGDIRSRLVRLIPAAQVQIRNLLNHRLADEPHAASEDWRSIVDGTSPLWPPIPAEARELLRSVLIHANGEIHKRARPPTSTFNFSRASVGNLFLTGARIFTSSFEAAIYLLALVCGIPERTAVIPAINSNFSHHIAAGLANGEVIVGQNAISHPSIPTALSDGQSGLATHSAHSTSNSIVADTSEEPDDAEDAHLPGTLASLRASSINFSKASPAPNTPSIQISTEHATDHPTLQTAQALKVSPAEDASPPLPAPILRIWYINPYGQELTPRANPRVVSAIRSAQAIVYSIGSLYTSIIPNLILRGVGAAIAHPSAANVPKILILNGSSDRETSGMTATDFVAAISRAGEESQGWRAVEPPVPQPSTSASAGAVSQAEMIDPAIWRRYVTHVIYLEGSGVPAVDTAALNAVGIQCVRCWGRRAPASDATAAAASPWHYDEHGLVGALELAMGKTARLAERSRRNTLENAGPVLRGGDQK